MKTFGYILLIAGLLSAGLAVSEMIGKKSAVDFDPLITTTRWTPLYKSTLAAIVFLGSGVIVLIVASENKTTRNKYRSR
jgi:hypothetical protein